MKYVVFCCGILGVFLFVAASIIGGLQIEGYSFIHQYISESFSEGLPNVKILRYVYMTSGCLLLLFGLLAPKVLELSGVAKVGFYVFAVFYGLGTFTVALFPCDFGCPTAIDNSSLSQLIHNGSAFFSYLIVPVCLMIIGVQLKVGKGSAGLSKVSLTCGILSLIFVLVLFSNATGAFIGLFQRIIEGSILFWVTYCAFYILRLSKTNY